MTEITISFIDLLVTVLSFAIIGRVIMSWISPRRDDLLSVILYQITEPIMGPIRKILPPLGMFDLAPMAAIFLLYAINRLLHAVLL